MKISVTGKFASGKSSFSEFLSHKKIKVLSGDDVGKEVLEENKNEILSLLKIKADDDYLRVMRMTFLEDEAKFIKYNNWMYMHLPEEIINRCSRYDDVIIDAALIFEWQIDEYFDLNILVTDGEFEERFLRASKSRKDSEKDLYRMLDKYQWSDAKKRIYADVCIENNGSLEELKVKSDVIFKKIFNTD